MSQRTFVIGDIHGEAKALDTILSKLPSMSAQDTLIFLGDYVDRGPDSLEVIERVQLIKGASSAKVITLKGNHEDMWLECYEKPNLGFLLPRPNGCAQTYRSLTRQPALADKEWLSPEEFERYVDVPSWFPREIYDWMESLHIWYEDEHALYVHAGLEGEGAEWFTPQESSKKALLWMREPDFFLQYEGKRLIFGHTPVIELPKEGQQTDGSAWRRGPLIGLDTGSGKGGFLSAVELPAMRFYEAR